MQCPMCQNDDDRQLEVLSHGWVLCYCCSKVTHVSQMGVNDDTSRKDSNRSRDTEETLVDDVGDDNSSNRRRDS